MWLTGLYIIVLVLTVLYVHQKMLARKQTTKETEWSEKGTLPLISMSLAIWGSKLLICSTSLLSFFLPSVRALISELACNWTLGEHALLILVRTQWAREREREREKLARSVHIYRSYPKGQNFRGIFKPLLEEYIKRLVISPYSFIKRKKTRNIHIYRRSFRSMEKFCIVVSCI